MLEEYLINKSIKSFIVQAVLRQSLKRVCETHLRVFAPEQHRILNLIVQWKKSWDKKIVVYFSIKILDCVKV